MPRSLLYLTGAVLIAILSTVLLVMRIRDEDRLWIPSYEEKFPEPWGCLVEVLVFLGYAAAFLLLVLGLVAL